MEKTLAFKLATIGLLVALLMIALSMIGHLVAERRARRNEVVQDIATSSTEEQQITGPILVIPYEKTVRQRRENDRGERHLEEREVSGQLHFLPEKLRARWRCSHPASSSRHLRSTAVSRTASNQSGF